MKNDILRVKGTLFSLAIVSAIISSSPSVAQSSGDEMVRIIVSLAPGGATDVGSRILAKAYTDRTGRQTIVENRPGGGGAVAAKAVKQTPGDGRTLVVLDNGGCCANQFINDVGFDALVDFKPVSMLWEYPLILVVAADGPYKSVQDLIAAAKVKRDGLTYGSQGVATGGHILGEMLSKVANISLVHVPFRGAAPAAIEVATGRVDMLFASYASVKSFIEDGKLRPLAATGSAGTPTLVPGFPDVRNLSETGFPSVVFGAWFVLLAPATTPAHILARLHTDFDEALRSREVMKTLDTLQMQVSKNISPQAVQDRMREEITMVAPIIKNLKPN